MTGAQTASRSRSNFRTRRRPSRAQFGLDGWALYCADDSRQTELELNRRREALDPQRQYSRAPDIIMRSGLQNCRVSKRTDELRLTTNPAGRFEAA